MDYYIDDTGVETDNRDLRTTELRYEDIPNTTFTIDTRFALEIVTNALENSEFPEDTWRTHANVLLAMLNKEEQ
jgi:hypothetical protein